MSCTIIRPKNREQWLELRKHGIGSSEIASVVGLNPWQSPYQLWLVKTGQDNPKPQNFAMTAGHYLEDAVSRFWQDATGREVIKSSAGDWLIQDDAHPFLQVSPDRTYWLGTSRSANAKGILECKTTQKAIDTDDIPRHWFAQVQYQLGVAGLQQGSLAWLTAGRNFDHKDLNLVPDFYAWLVDEASRFWQDNVLGGKEPELTTLEDVMHKYNQHTPGKVAEASIYTYEAWGELKAVRDNIAQLKEQQEQLEEKLKLAIGDAESIAYEGQTLATWRAAKASQKFDAKAYQADHPDLCQPYIKAVPGSRRFLLK